MSSPTTRFLHITIPMNKGVLPLIGSTLSSRGAGGVSSITPLALADSSSVKPGQTAIALGSPFGVTDSITLGVISGLGRSVFGGKTGMIQADAGIQPGNSGGPLVDSRGEVIGVITAIEAAGPGIGFAIPSSVVKRELPGMKSGAQTNRP